MAGVRRPNLRARLAGLERMAGGTDRRDQRRVAVYLPRKDGDGRPPGAYPLSAGALMVLYEPGRPDPPLPEGW